MNLILGLNLMEYFHTNSILSLISLQAFCFFRLAELYVVRNFIGKKKKLVVDSNSYLWFCGLYTFLRCLSTMLQFNSYVFGGLQGLSEKAYIEDACL